MLKFEVVVGPGEKADLIKGFERIYESVPDSLNGILRQGVIRQAEAMNVPFLSIWGGDSSTSRYSPSTIIRGEIFVGQSTLCGVSIYTREFHDPNDARGTVRAYVLSMGEQSEEGREFLEAIRATFGVKLRDRQMITTRSESISTDELESFSGASTAEMSAAAVLQDATYRQLAIGVATGAGVMESDLPKLLTGDARDRIEEAKTALLDAGIAASETVILCKRTSQPINRVDNADAVASLAEIGLRCSCGKLVNEERLESALNITPLGRVLLDKSRWMTLVLVNELRNIGLLDSDIYIEQQLGGDEVDCVAVIAGDMILFELKDGEFSLGHAYSFNAKTGIVRPDRAVIVTTVGVGNDAREHFRRRRQAEVELRRSRGGVSDQEPVFMEGLDTLANELEKMANDLVLDDARRIISDTLHGAAPNVDLMVAAWLASR